MRQDEIENYTISYVNGTMTVEDVSYPLYNFAVINGKWYRLQRQENAIITEKPLPEYVKNLDEKSQRILQPSEYTELLDYNWQEQVIIINNREYYYSEDGKPNPDHPTNGFYTMEPRTNEYIVAWKNKISGWTDNWIIPEDERYVDPENKMSFHRNFNVTLYDAVVVVANNGANNVIYNATTQSTKPGYTSWIENRDGTRTKVGGDLFGFSTYAEGLDAGNYTVDFTNFEYGKMNGNRFAAKTETGTLTIKPRAITVEAKNSWFTYNGKAQTNPNYSVNNIRGTDQLTAVVEGSITNVSESPAANKVVSYEFTSGKPENYTVTTKNGTLTMKPKGLTITTGSASRAYNGTPLTNTSNPRINNLLNGETASITATGTITDVGSVPNSYELTWGTADPSNYTITEKLGTLTVTPVTSEVVVTITEHSDEAAYDGNVHTVTGYDVTSISNPLYTANDFRFDGNATITATDAGSYPMELATSDFTNTSDNFTNVRFVIVDGSLVINPAAITITAEEKTAIMQAVADELDYWEPESWSATAPMTEATGMPRAS